MAIMKKKKTILSVAAGVLMLLTLSFGTGASALNDPGHGGGGTVKPPTCTKYPCPIRP
ncbi:hypothetical protein H9650_19705 [Psychrobacillus sp. Sa2BUA9]|uniref:Uncharacterized protein n=1 Tax=Psychrobacillus faecigallinarum TaxID=2762235 RepID=A0ABR8RF11_9BACI|nr:hypothetical protein [Psychrobacillus faecigallinarum]MBD7946330.1 hypothetical protein [Psychrobacillus faecigallinarum]